MTERGGVHPSASPSRLHSRTGCHCGPFRWLWSPQTAFCISRQNGWRHKTMSGWDDDYAIVIQCQSVLWTCFFFSPQVVFSPSWRNMLLQCLKRPPEITQGHRQYHPSFDQLHLITDRKRTLYALVLREKQLQRSGRSIEVNGDKRT